MSNSRINLSDLKESNINQLTATEMLMVLGGCDRGRNIRRNKYGRDSYSNKNGSGCSPIVTPPSNCSGSGSSVSAPVDVEAV